MYDMYMYDSVPALHRRQLLHTCDVPFRLRSLSIKMFLHININIRKIKYILSVIVKFKFCFQRSNHGVVSDCSVNSICDGRMISLCLCHSWVICITYWALGFASDLVHE